MSSIYIADFGGSVYNFGGCMAFDKDKFQNTDFRYRTAKVPVPELKHFFDEDEVPEWNVRNLSGSELAQVNEASKQNKMLSELVETFMSENYTDQIKAIKERLGLTEEVPDEVVRGISLIKHGSVNPTCTQEMAVRLAETNPVPFYRIWRKIIELSGLGHSLGELDASTQTQESK